MIEIIGWLLGVLLVFAGGGVAATGFLHVGLVMLVLGTCLLSMLN